MTSVITRFGTRKGCGTRFRNPRPQASPEPDAPALQTDHPVIFDLRRRLFNPIRVPDSTADRANSMRRPTLTDRDVVLTMLIQIAQMDAPAFRAESRGGAVTRTASPGTRPRLPRG